MTLSVISKEERLRYLFYIIFGKDLSYLPKAFLWSFGENETYVILRPSLEGRNISTIKFGDSSFHSE